MHGCFSLYFKCVLSRILPLQPRRTPEPLSAFAMNQQMWLLLWGFPDWHNSVNHSTAAASTNPTNCTEIYRQSLTAASLLWLSGLVRPCSPQRPSRTWGKMQRCALHWDIKNVDREPSWCRPSSEYHKPHAPFLIPS